MLGRSKRSSEQTQKQIDALAILLSSTRRAGNPHALLALRDALKGAPQHFTEQNLERAFRARYHKALVDIISMVKHATADTAPLLTAEERVDAAIAKVVDGRELTAEQSAWFEYIRQHLIENLSIDREDFDVVPALSDHGGWGSANRGLRRRARPNLLAKTSTGELAAA